MPFAAASTNKTTDPIDKRQPIPATTTEHIINPRPHITTAAKFKPKLICTSFTTTSQPLPSMYTRIERSIRVNEVA